MTEPTVESRYMDMAQAVEALSLSTGRPVRLIAVSKTFPLEKVEEAYRAGAREFGENYVQEGVEKAQAMKALVSDTTWHMIGPIQSNKTRPVAETFDWVQSLDREKIAQRLNDQRPEGMPPLNVLIEVNLDEEETKSGIKLEDVPAFAAFVAMQPRLVLRGLMAIPDPHATMEHKSRQFSRLASVYETLKATYSTIDTLSMGMSADWEEAIRHGSTMVRLGRQIFGARAYPQKK